MIKIDNNEYLAITIDIEYKTLILSISNIWVHIVSCEKLYIF